MPMAKSAPPIKMEKGKTTFENDIPLDSTLFDLHLRSAGPENFVSLSNSPVSNFLKSRLVKNGYSEDFFGKAKDA